jgi:predicted small lipoprotein YifL
MLCWPRTLFLLLVAFLALGHMIAACGQKGPLYLPEPAEDAPAAAEAVPTPRAAPAASDQDRDAPDDVPRVRPDAEAN